MRSSSNHQTIFLQDSVPYHSAILVKEVLKAENIIVILLPAQSYDLNPIGNLYKILCKKIRKHRPVNITTLWRKVQDELNKIVVKTICEILKKSNILI